jgi:hypothetical protein
MSSANTQTREITFSPEQTLTYVNVPFDVPEGIGRIDVSYHYDGAIGSDPTLTGGNTIDIGLFDPRGAGFMAEGFRGWSGSARSEFFVALDDATPGYLPGPIQAGRWSICLGAYKVAPDGCRCLVTITLTPDAGGDEGHFPPLLALNDTPTTRPRADGWYRGELHCHTVHSDGDSTPEMLIRLAESLGLDFLAITDHNNITHLADLARQPTDLILIPGYEVTTYYGHWNIWGGDGRWIDFRVRSAADLIAAMTEADQRGYLVSCNHPRPYGPPWAFEDATGYASIEVWNGPWELFNDHALAFWEARARAGQRINLIGGSDAHFLQRDHIASLGHPTTFVYSAQPPSAASLLKSLRAGRAFVTESPDGPRLDLTARLLSSSAPVMMGDTIICSAGATIEIRAQARGGRGSTLELRGAPGLLTEMAITEDDQRVITSIDPALTVYVYARLVDGAPQTTRAITNPIWIVAE